MIGHNSKLTEEETKHLFLDEVRKDMELLDKIKALQADRKKNRKIAQSYGFALADIDYAAKTIEAEDKQRVRTRLSSQAQILFWLNVVPGYQSDLFKDRAPGLEKIKNDGYRAGLRASERKSGFPDASEENREWHAGYDLAQSERADHLKSAMEKANAAAAESSGAPRVVKSGEVEGDDAAPKKSSRGKRVDRSLN